MDVYYSNYSIGVDVYQEVPQVVKYYGKQILLIGGEKALQAGKEKLVRAIAGTNLSIAHCVISSHECSYAEMDRIISLVKDTQIDMVFGMGGGKAIDNAKGVAEKMGLPVFTFPTIAATCAATTALSVVYREDGNFEEFYFYERPAIHCFIDLDIIANAPAIYLQAGMGDTIGKYFECHFSARGDQLAHSSRLGRTISEMCYFPLLDHGVKALSDCKNHVVSEELQEAVLANIVSTGLVSLMVLDQYNCAVAHSVYYGLVLLPGFEEENLHGNVVSYGVLVQLAVDGEVEQAKEVKEFLKQLGIRTTLAEMGVELDRTLLDPVLKETVTGPDMDHIPYPINEDMIFEAMKIVEQL